MKTKTKKILITTIIVLLLITIACFVSAQIYSKKLGELFITSKIYNSIPSESTPGAGEFLLIAGTLGLITDFTSIVTYYYLLIFLPIIIILSSIIIQIIARLFQIGNPSKTKNTISKCLLWLSIAILIILCIYFIIFVVDFKIISHLIPLLICIAAIVLNIKELIKK